MLRFSLRIALAIACFSLAGFVSVSGQTAPAAPAPSTNAAGTNAPSATPPAAPIALSDIVNQAQIVTTKLRDDQAALAAAPATQAIAAALPALTRQIDQHLADDRELLQESPSLNSLQSSQASWQSLAANWSASAKTLSDRAKNVDETVSQLGQQQAQWQATLNSSRKAPPEIIQRIQAVLAAITATTKTAQLAQAQIFSVQTQIAEQTTRIKNGLDAIAQAQGAARNRLFKQDDPPLWNVEATTRVGATLVAQERDSLHMQTETLQTYLAGRMPAIFIHLLILALLVAGFFWIRRATRSQAEKDATLADAARIFNVPLATGVLLALLATGWLYPDAPRLLWAVVGAVALIPAVIIIRRLIEPAIFPLLYATVIAYFVDQLRDVLMPAGILSRFLFIFELLAASLFLLVALRSRSLSTAHPERTRLERISRTYIHIAFLAFIFAGSANVLGYVHLGYLAGDGMLKSSYLAVIFYAAVRIADALVFAALNIRPLTRLGMVRRHHELLYTNTSAFIRWLAFALWIVAALQIFTVRDPLWQAATHILTKYHSWGWMKFQLGPILAFPVTVWASFLLSRFIRFALEEEVYPKLQLGRGIPYAASTMVHYTILVVGFFAALDALGVDLTRFSVLAGAFGVGLGFGLQNIMNNFVSGVILLFERPVKVGDIVQVDTNVGTIRRIGIRASVILLTNGSEYIVPNGNLISNPVTNWTLSNCERLIEIPVSVTSQADPQHVLDLLTRVAKAHPKVLKNPPAQTLLVTFGGAALAFRVRAWIDSEDEWMKVTSDLSLALHAALAAENVAMS